MNSISSKAGMESVYLTAKKVYENLLTTKQGVSRLRTSLDSSEASIKMYFDIYACMRKGRVYKMGTSEGFTRYLLESILRDEGEDAFLLALSAAKSNSMYRESVNNSQPGIKKACIDAITTSGLSIDYDSITVDSAVARSVPTTSSSSIDTIVSTDVSNEDLKKLVACINLPNATFASTTMQFLSRYSVLTKDDLQILTSQAQCATLFKSSYPILKEIDPKQNVGTQLKDLSGRNRYYGETYTISGSLYVFTSQLYGLGTSPTMRDNRSPFHKWLLGKIGVATDSNWWPALGEYNPQISTKKWLELLNAPDVLGENIRRMLAGMYAQGGAATCAQLAELYGKTANHYIMTVVHAAENVVKATGCPLIQDQENSKLWPIFFVGRNEAKTDRYIWKIRDELYDALTEYGIVKYLEDDATRGGEKEMTIKEKVAAIKAYTAAKGFNYEGDLIENFYLSLKSKPFVILAGTSGTGKTRLVKLFAEAIGAKMKLVPVRPDWSDSSDLFGYTDLSNHFHPGAIIEFIKQAEWDKETPYFICLDEMNLARVEYYLSDFLSIIETRDRRSNGMIETDTLIDIPYYKDPDAEKKFGRVYIPENLYIIGTVNMDETTFPFSKKVLDRANTIEFSFVDLLAKASAGGVPVPQKLDNNFLKTDYLYLQDCDDLDLVESVCLSLQELNQILVKANLHVGYRIRDEICFYMMNNKAAELLPEDAAFDHEIMQKILPRIQGSSAAIKDVLSELFIKCAGDYTGFAGTTAYEQMNSYLDNKPTKYPNSAKKISFMMRRYEEDGFTSYWL